MEVIAVIGNFIKNKFKKICLLFTFHHTKKNMINKYQNKIITLPFYNKKL